MHKFLMAAALGVAGLPGLALAQDTLPDVAVSYADLDLSTSEGVATLDRRLNRAVQAACPSDKGVSDLALRREVMTCRAMKKQQVASLRSDALAQASLAGKAVASAAH